MNRPLASRLGRRTMLRGAGIGVALPLLDAMIDPGIFGVRVRAATAPVRLFTWFWTNGTRNTKWFPSSGPGPLSSDQLAPAMQALKAAGGETDIVPWLNVVGGVTDTTRMWKQDHMAAMFAAGDGDQRSGYGNWPTTATIDQVVASKFGKETRFPSLVLSAGWEAGPTARINISWQEGQRPITPIYNPTTLFKQMFGGAMPPAGTPAAGGTDTARAAARRKSILDAVKEDGARLLARVGAEDKSRVQEHLEAIRGLEKEIADAKMTPAGGASCSAPPSTEFDRGILKSNLEASDREPLLIKLLVMAVKCDLSRYGSFMLDNASGQKSYPAAGSPGGDHDLSHGAPDDVIVKRTNVKLAYLASALRQLAALKEGDRPLLDNVIIYSNSEVFDGALHSRDHMPIIVAGGGGGRLKGGRYLRFEKKPLNDLFSSLLSYAGVPTQRFGRIGDGPLAGF